MSKKDFIKITIQDIEIAEEFFDGKEKHLNEFLINVILYYRGKTPTIKTKIVQKYFKTYKKTMDFIIGSKLSGKLGFDIKAENERLRQITLEGSHEVTPEGTLQPKKKEERTNYKELREKFKVEFKNSLHQFLEKYGKDMLNEFYMYWTEHNEEGKKLRYQFAKNQPFNLERRLITWFSREKKGERKDSAQKKDPVLEANEQVARIHKLLEEENELNNE